MNTYIYPTIRTFNRPVKPLAWRKVTDVIVYHAGYFKHYARFANPACWGLTATY